MKPQEPSPNRPSGPERIPVRILADHEAVDRAVAERIADLIRERSGNRERTVLGLATGSTFQGIYRELARLHREEGLDFSGVATFNLDEYFPMDPGSLQSYHRFMRECLFDQVNIPEEGRYVPRGDLARDDMEAHCRAYEEAIREAGGIHLQLLGIGRTGHIGFNEPGSGRGSRTRLVFLDTVTRRDAASDFFGEPNVPLEAITMGVATIFEAREIVLVATGEHKAPVVRRAVEGEAHPDVPASYLQEHSRVTLYVEPAAAAGLTRVRAPWLLEEVAWTPRLEQEAVTWLSRTTGKSILRLATADYRDHHLSPLVARYGSAEPLNGQVFNALIAKIRGRSKLPRDRRVLVFSPHPDDDVISMGGILRKLVQNGNRITVAYQTSGNLAVFDHEVRRYLDFLRRVRGLVGGAPAPEVRGEREIEEALASRPPGEPDAPVVQEIKRVIRETEAVSALESVGLEPESARFLNLPFYRTGRVRKDPVSGRDVALCREALEETAPDLVFVAGDLSDPHGTHRICLEAVRRALGEYGGPAPEVWLYRGAWEEWPVSRATVLVPLSEDELRRKILAIFKHQSQKDLAPFPGPDDREFWERVEERNRGTADDLASLGLPAYYAMEAYVVERDGEVLENPPAATGSLRES